MRPKSNAFAISAAWERSCPAKIAQSISTRNGEENHKITALARMKGSLYYGAEVLKKYCWVEEK